MQCISSTQSPPIEATLHPDGPFSPALFLAMVRRRNDGIVDVVEGDHYRRLLDHHGRPLLLTASAAYEPPVSAALSHKHPRSTEDANSAPSQALRLQVRILDDAPPGADDISFAATALTRIATLDRSPTPFYDHVATDPVLAPLTERYRGMRPLGSPSIFEMLIVAILGQQISMIAANAIKRRMVERLGLVADFDGVTYRAFPSPESLAVASQEDLLGMAFSRRKAEYVRDLARQVAGGELDLEALRGQPHQWILEQLVALRGIGHWTAEYVLLRGYGYPDALPAGDAGLRRQITRLYGLTTPPTEAEIIARGEVWRPYRSWATLYLWNADSLPQ